MIKTRIIPCLDIKNGRVVKGVNFGNLVDAGSPIYQAEFYYKEGADEICLLDISASIEKREILFDIVFEVSKKCFIPFSVGGGVSKIEDFSRLMLCGADKVSVNSAAIINPELISSASNKFGSQAVIIAIDVKKKGDKYEVFSNGGTKSTGLNAVEWAVKAQSMGAGEILLTSMDMDGTKNGYDLELIKNISSKLSIPVIASGGVGSLNDLKNGINSGASAVLAASIFHFREYTIKQAKDFLSKEGIEVRN